MFPRDSDGKGCKGSYGLNVLPNDLGNVSRPDCFATLADGKTLARLHGYSFLQLHAYRKIVSWHHHFNSFGQLNDASNIGSAEEELRAISLEE
ncbi:uncharacterized protein METZ01_LOCUS474463, partial [marine metagenome]